MGDLARILTILSLIWIQESTSRTWESTFDKVNIEDFRLEGDIEETLHGVHASDLLDSYQATVSRDAFFFLYRNECKNAIDSILTPDIRQFIPASPYLSLLRHNYANYYNMIWFDTTGRSYNAKRAYQLKEDQCACIVPIKRGNKTIFEYGCQELPASKDAFIGLVWREMGFETTIYNALKKHVKVKINGKGPKLPNLFIPPNTTSTTHIYPSYNLLAFSLEDDEFIGGWHILNRENTQINLTTVDQSENEKVWEMKVKLESMKEVEHQSELAGDHALRNFAVLTQPSRVPEYSDTGFKKLKIPMPLYEVLVKIYENNKDNVKGEYTLPRHFTIWNSEEVAVNRISLDKEITRVVHKFLQPMAEKFCNCKLKPLIADNIETRLRIYRTGNRVRLHVDELRSGHIIGSILHITRDLAGEENWPLELISHDGKIHTIYNSPGDMILFESSRVPHARPLNFRGRFFVNTFLYYYPESGWEMPIEEDPTFSSQVKTEL